MDSILNSIKKLLGIDENYKVFDTDIIIHINSTFSILYQLGVGPEEPFKITSSEETWDSFLEDKTKIEMVKTYIYMKVKTMFDPPTGGYLTAIQEQIKELEWRLNVSEDYN